MTLVSRYWMRRRRVRMIPILQLADIEAPEQDMRYLKYRDTRAPYQP